MRHFYHLYCGLPWEGIAREHVQALHDSGASWQVTVGLVGPASARHEAWSWFRREIADVTFTEADEGWEQVTLRELHRWAIEASPGQPVLYAHAKGVTHRTDTPVPGLLGTVWRQSMTALLVGRWRACITALDSYDAVGCHWSTPEAYPGYIEIPFFGGNFWWAESGFLAGLPPVLDGDRHEAETWIGRGRPRVLDLRPGWPDLAHFAAEVSALLNPGSRVEITGPRCYPW